MGGACDGCLHFTRTGLDVYLANPKLMEGVEKITFVIGNNAEVPEKLDHHPPKSYVFVVGDCTNKHRDRGIFLPGCASTSMHRTFFPGKIPKRYSTTTARFSPRNLTWRAMRSRSNPVRSDQD